MCEQSTQQETPNQLETPVSQMFWYLCSHKTRDGIFNELLFLVDKTYVLKRTGDVLWKVLFCGFSLFFISGVH